MEDKCSGCIRINPEMKFKVKMCPKCNKETYECYLDGRSYIENCTNCGTGGMSFSFYGNCEGQRDICEYILDFSNVRKEGVREFGKRYNMNLATLLKLIRVKKVVRLKCEISDVLEEEEFFKNIELGYVMDPPMPYGNFYTCKDAIRPKWFDRCIEIVVDE